MRRRDFLALTGAATLAAPLRALAQQLQMKRLAYLFTLAENDPQSPAYIAAMREGLAEQGWSEGKNLLIDYRYDVAKTPEFLTQTVREAIAEKPDVILTANATATVEAFAQTSSIPIVMGLGGDPSTPAFKSMLGNDAVHPSRNVTGFSTFEQSLGAKFLEIMREIDPSLTTAVYIWSVLVDPNVDANFPSFATAAMSVGVQAIPLKVSNEAEILAGIAQAAQPNTALYIRETPITLSSRDRIISEVQSRKVIAVYSHTLFATAGAMITYSIDQIANFQGAGNYAGQIFNGVKIADLPYQFPTRYILTINLKTAEAIGVTIPQSLLVQATEVIQ